jgi:hypothetical protein
MTKNEIYPMQSLTKTSSPYILHSQNTEKEWGNPERSKLNHFVLVYIFSVLAADLLRSISQLIYLNICLVQSSKVSSSSLRSYMAISVSGPISLRSYMARLVSGPISVRSYTARLVSGPISLRSYMARSVSLYVCTTNQLHNLRMQTSTVNGMNA